MLLAEIHQPTFWLALGKVIWIDMLLSGDNALVIAMACRALPPRQRLIGMMLGAAGAVALRIVCTGTLARLMELPYLKLAGGAALLFIATKLLIPSDDGSEAKAPERLLTAVGTIIIADITMSIDNVVAVAAAANGSLALLVIGLLISIPLIVAGAALISSVLGKLPVLVWAGAALLGWIAGEVIADDRGIAPLIAGDFNWLPLSGAIGVGIVLIAGALWRAHLATSETKHA